MYTLHVVMYLFTNRLHKNEETELHLIVVAYEIHILCFDFAVLYINQIYKYGIFLNLAANNMAVVNIEQGIKYCYLKDIEHSII